MIFIGDIRNFVFGCVKIMRFLRKQRSSDIRWAAQRSGNLGCGSGWRHLKVVASVCTGVELWIVFRRWNSGHGDIVTSRSERSV